MKQVTIANLEAVVERINTITKSPLSSYTKTKDGKYKANIGNYHLSGAYGGWCLHRMHNEGGGVEDVLRVGYVSKRELLNLLHSFITGLYAAEEKSA